MSNMQRASSRLIAPFMASRTVSRDQSSDSSRLTDRQVRYFSDVLGVPTTATERHLKQAFYQRSKETHPDLNCEDPNAQRNFEKVAEAYDKLLGHCKRVKQENVIRVAYNPDRPRNYRSWVRPRPTTATQQHSNQPPSQYAYEPEPSPSINKKQSSSSEFCDNAYRDMLKRDSKLHAQRRSDARRRKTAQSENPSECAQQ